MPVPRSYICQKRHLITWRGGISVEIAVGKEKKEMAMKKNRFKNDGIRLSWNQPRAGQKKKGGTAGYFQYAAGPKLPSP